MYKDLSRTCKAIVLLITLLVSDVAVAVMVCYSSLLSKMHVGYIDTQLCLVIIYYSIN